MDCIVHGVTELDTTDWLSFSPITKLIKSFYTNVQSFIFYWQILYLELIQLNNKKVNNLIQKMDKKPNKYFSKEGIHLAGKHILDFPGWPDGKEFTCNAGDLASIPGLGRSPGGGHGNPLKYSSLENPHGQTKLVGYSPWGHKESGMTEQLSVYLLSTLKRCMPSLFIWGIQIKIMKKYHFITLR